VGATRAFKPASDTRRAIDCPRDGDPKLVICHFISQLRWAPSTHHPGSPNRQPGGAGSRWHDGCKQPWFRAGRI